MSIEQKRAEVSNLCMRVIDELAEEQLDAVCRDKEYFEARFKMLAESASKTGSYVPVK